MIIICFYTLLYLYLTIFLIISIKLKRKDKWYYLFSGIFLAILNIIATIIYIFYVSAYNLSFPSESSEELMTCFVVALLSIFPLLIITIISIIFVIIQVKRNQIINQYENKFTIDKKRIAKTFGIISVILIIVYCTQTFKYQIENKIETNNHNEIKNEEILKMLNFINNKYNLSLQIKDCIYYREEDYTRHEDILGNGTTYNIPYIAVFENNNEQITVVDRKGIISDNRQLKELNKIIANYFKEKTGIDFEFVQVSKSFDGGWSSGNDNIINKVIQNDFNELITNENITEFIDNIFGEENLRIEFYVKNSRSREVLINDITQKLKYLETFKNIEIVEVYAYEQELIVSNIKIDFLNVTDSDDYYDSYKFGSYYVDLNSNNFVFSATMELDRGYSSGSGELINGWRIRSLK